MQKAQEKLGQALPLLIQILLAGDMDSIDGGGYPEFLPAKDIHLAVVSTDLGLTSKSVIHS